MNRRICTLLLVAISLVNLAGPVLAQCTSQGGVGFYYSGPYNIGSCGMLGLGTCAVQSCTDLTPLPEYPQICAHCIDPGTPTDSFNCYYFGSPNVGCGCNSWGFEFCF